MAALGLESYELEVVDTDRKVIEVVKKLPVLYDTSDPDYHNSEICDRAWEFVGRAISISASDAQKRWNKMLRMFAHLFRKQKSNGESRSRWHNYEAMTFMIPYIPREPENKKKRNYGGNYVLVGRASADYDSSNANEDGVLVQEGDHTNALVRQIVLNTNVKNEAESDDDSAETEENFGNSVSELKNTEESQLENRNVQMELGVEDLVFKGEKPGEAETMDADMLNAVKKCRKVYPKSSISTLAYPVSTLAYPVSTLAYPVSTLAYPVRQITNIAGSGHIKDGLVASASDEDDNLLFFKGLLPAVRTLSEAEAFEFRLEVHKLLMRFVSNHNTLTTMPDPFRPLQTSRNSQSCSDNNELMRLILS